LNSSGDMKNGVPITVWARSHDPSNTRAMPRSPTCKTGMSWCMLIVWLTLMISDLLRKMLEVLRSRCKICLSWRYYGTPQHYSNTLILRIHPLAEVAVSCLWAYLQESCFPIPWYLYKTKLIMLPAPWFTYHNVAIWLNVCLCLQGFRNKIQFPMQ